jgi:hypothetical protein
MQPGESTDIPSQIGHSYEPDLAAPASLCSRLRTAVTGQCASAGQASHRDAARALDIFLHLDELTHALAM